MAVVGAAVFGLVHAVEALRWRAWFDPAGRYDPWFLNNGVAVGFAAAMFLLVGIVVGMRAAARRPFGDAVIDGLNMAGGAAVAMIAVLLSIGPGTIFPIVVVFGAVVVAVSITAGAALGWSGGRALGVRA
jgi:hypothetical protein